MEDDPWKMTKLKKSVWDRLDKARMEYDRSQAWRDRPELSLSDTILILLNVHDGVKEKGVEIDRCHGGYMSQNRSTDVDLTFPESKDPDDSDSEEESS